MSNQDQQSLLDIISHETEKLANLRKAYSLENNSIKKKKNESTIATDDAETELVRERLDFEIQCKKESDERRQLLHAMILECKESGFKMPPSLIKLLNYNNCKYFSGKKTYFFLRLFKGL